MKKRNLTAIIIASSMMLALAGCSVTAESDSENANTSEVSVNTEAEAPEADEDSADYTSGIIANKPSSPDAADASFEYNGKTVTFTDDLDKIKSALGEPASEDEAPNSDDPKDRMYTYGTDPNTLDLIVISGKVSGITIYDSAVKTSRGISIGSSDKDIIAAYGEAEATKLDGVHDIEYNFGDYTMSFFLDKNNNVETFGYYSE